MRGAIFENYVVMEVIKHRYNRGLLNGVYFYRDSNQNEVDILLKEEGEITAIEACSFGRVVTKVNIVKGLGGSSLFWFFFLCCQRK